MQIHHVEHENWKEREKSEVEKLDEQKQNLSVVDKL